MANIKVQGVGAPIACKTVGSVTSLSLPRTMAFLHGEYFSGSLHTLPRFMKNDRGICGLVDLSAGFPLPSIEVVRSLRLELYPRFAIADPNCLSLPFRLKGQDAAVRISSPFRRPDGPKPIYRKEEGKLV